MAPPFGSPVKYDYLRIVRKIEPWARPPLEFGQKNGLNLSEDLFFGLHLHQFGIKIVLLWCLSPFPNSWLLACPNPPPPPFKNPAYATACGAVTNYQEPPENYWFVFMIRFESGTIV